MMLPAIMWLVRPAVIIMPDCISRDFVAGFTAAALSCTMVLNVTASKVMPQASLAPKLLVYLCTNK